MLFLIGLGMDVKDLSVRALEAVKKSDAVYLEQYTTFVSEDYLSYLRRETGKEIRPLDRSAVEENALRTLAGAKGGSIAILVPGDPLIATTHHATLLDTATKSGVSYVVYHAPSIYTAAIGESGLDVYKFGPPVTLPFWSERYKPTSFLDVIDKNVRNDEHSLLLLDIDQPAGRMMTLGDAVELLRKAEKDKEYGIIDDSLKLLVLGDVGKPSELIKYVSIGEAAEVESLFAGKILTIIIPATPSFAEEEALSKFA